MNDYQIGLLTRIARALEGINSTLSWGFTIVILIVIGILNGCIRIPK